MMTTLPFPLARLGAAALALALTACVTIPPDRHAIAQRPIPAALAEAPLAPGAWPSANWWSAYGDARLDALVAQALRSNPSLDVARARIDAANAAAGLQRAQSGARLGLDAGLNRQRYSGNGLFPEPIGGNFYNDASVQLKGGYDFDWWGKQRALTAAALGEANARLAEQAQARQVLAAAVAHSYFELQFIRARQANAQAQLDAARALLLEKTKRIAHGLARADERQAAELDVARLDQLDAHLSAAAARERAALRALAGPGALPEPAPLAQAAPVHALPERLGMELLARRADRQAARYRVEAALGRIDAARAAFYPDFNLVGAVGLDAVSLGRLLHPGSLTMLVGSALQLPLFDNGRLGASLAGVRAQRDEAIADYNQAIVNAVREVGQQGAALRGLDQELARQASARGAADALLASARLRAEHGLGDRAAALQAELGALAQGDTALQLRLAQRQAEISLNQALGGGFDAAAPADTLTSTLSPRSHD
jgi:multidrug efflux system outer membrane protein